MTLAPPADEIRVIDLATAEVRAAVDSGSPPSFTVTTEALHPTAAPEGGGFGYEYARGFAVCFFRALAATARRNGVDVAGSSVRVKVAVRHAARVILAVDVEVALPHASGPAATRLLTVAERTCPFAITGRTFGDVDVRIVADLPSGRTARR